MAEKTSGTAGQARMPLTQVHLAVYTQLMEWRRVMYVESDDQAKVMGVAGEAWHWAELTDGDLKFIMAQVEKLAKMVNPSNLVPVKPKPTKLSEEDLLA